MLQVSKFLNKMVRKARTKTHPCGMEDTILGGGTIYFLLL